jgi:hypothetical protein
MSVPAITLLSAIALVTAMPSKRAEQYSDAPTLESPAGLFTTYALYRNVASGLFLRLERPAERGLQGKFHVHSPYKPRHLI